MPNAYVNKVQLADGTSLIDISGTTATAADVAAGKYFYNAAGEWTPGTASGGGVGISQDQDGYLVLDPSGSGGGGGGGGGASNYVTGTFTGSTGGTGQSVSVPYSGSGYPVAVTIYPSSGARKSGDAITTLIQQYAIIAYCAIKEDISIAPTYSGEISANFSTVFAIYKGSTSEASSTNANRIVNATAYITWSVYDGIDAIVRFSDSTTMNVYIKNGSDLYGFAQGIEYTYQIIYSE